MLKPDEVLVICERRYATYLRSIVTGEPFFPLQIPFGRPAPGDDWHKLAREITLLDRGNLGYRIEWDDIRTRRWGMQRLPQRVWVDDEPAYLQLLQRQAEAATFREMLDATRQRLPVLVPWLSDNAKWAIEHRDCWNGLLRVCTYFLANPRPNRFARELPIAVDTKFIERYRSILRSMLDYLLPGDARTEDTDFERRFGLRVDEPLVHLRLLDPLLRDRLQLCIENLAAPVSQLATLGWSELIVLVVENKKTYLTLPLRSNTIALFAFGAAAELLNSLSWLENNRILYWGDLDVHGFHILSRLRRTFPHIESLMMDRDTLERFEPLCGPAKEGRYEEVQGLTAAEQAVYQTVKAHNLLLEQEKIPHEYVLQKVSPGNEANSVPKPLGEVKDAGT
ncbi:MAG: Wadjet anti-phage system protein JetD domain-containing protein [Steroidobacteraceae bacterium]